MATKELMTVKVVEENGKLQVHMSSAGTNWAQMLRNTALMVECMKKSYVELQCHNGGNAEVAKKFFDAFMRRTVDDYLQGDGCGQEGCTCGDTVTIRSRI